jgi:hypothetical protein
VATENPVSVDELPDDPLLMPPPYWRSSAALFHVKHALGELERRMKRLPPLLDRTSHELVDFYGRYKTKSEREAASDEHWKIVSRPLGIEHLIRLSCEVISLMSAIAAEDSVNCFCVFNLHKHIAESIEKLSMPEKLLVACTAVGASEAKGATAFESARRLVSWRNAFAHGHCVDRPTKSLRHNHLISPSEYWSVPAVFKEAFLHSGDYLTIRDYLRSKSLNPFLRSPNLDDEEIRRSLRRLSRYKFTGPNEHYRINVAPKAEA